jgi:hypothetical protein
LGGVACRKADNLTNLLESARPEITGVARDQKTGRDVVRLSPFAKAEDVAADKKRETGDSRQETGDRETAYAASTIALPSFVQGYGTPLGSY